MNWLLLTGVLGLAAGPSGDNPNVEARIKALAPEAKAELLQSYEYSAWIFSKALKFRRLPAIFLSCPDSGCDPSATALLADLREQAPATLGARAPDRDSAQIEIYMAPLPSIAEARNRELDDELHLDVNTTSRRFSHPDEDAPCWTVSYFHKTGEIEKAVVYIDSDSSSRMQSLCLGYETVRAAGVMSLEGPNVYRKAEKRRLRNSPQWLLFNAYLHGLKTIEPGDSMEKVHAALQEIYGDE